MINLTNTEAALLGLLAEEPRHPYDLEKQVEYRDMRFWTDLSMSSIYKLLRKLESAGLVERTNHVTRQNRLRKLYSLSDEGKAALRAKITSLLTEPEHVKWQVDIGTYNSDLIDRNALMSALDTYRESLKAKADGYRDLLAFLKESGCPRHRWAVAKRPIHLLEAEIAWVNEYLDELDSRI